jgi:uncharacterized protein YndB with AHSA1/START domain
MTAQLTESLDRDVTIRAPRDLVFKFFTDTPRWASWWGAGSTIDARVDGEVLIVYPGGTRAVGKVLELDPPKKIVFSYGYAKGVPIPPGESRVTIELESVREGTRVRLHHAFADANVRQQHVQGWRYQLSLFSNVVANEMHANAAATVDAWFAMWSEPKADVRHRELDRIAASDLMMLDRFSTIYGIDDVRAHVDAVHQHMPGSVLRRDGDVQHCQGQLLAKWTVAGADGPRGAGTNVFLVDADGRIQSVTGFWNA